MDNAPLTRPFCCLKFSGPSDNIFNLANSKSGLQPTVTCFTRGCTEPHNSGVSALSSEKCDKANIINNIAGVCYSLYIYD